MIPINYPIYTTWFLIIGAIGILINSSLLLMIAIHKNPITLKVGYAILLSTIISGFITSVIVTGLGVYLKLKDSEEIQLMCCSLYSALGLSTIKIMILFFTCLALIRYLALIHDMTFKPWKWVLAITTISAIVLGTNLGLAVGGEYEFSPSRLYCVPTVRMDRPLSMYWIIFQISTTVISLTILTWSYSRLIMFNVNTISFVNAALAKPLHERSFYNCSGLEIERSRALYVSGCVNRKGKLNAKLILISIKYFSVIYLYLSSVLPHNVLWIVELFRGSIRSPNLDAICFILEISIIFTTPILIIVLHNPLNQQLKTVLLNFKLFN
jgi:hypothetical protein